MVEELESHIEGFDLFLRGNAGAHERLDRTRSIIRSGEHSDSARVLLQDLIGALNYIPSPRISTAAFDDLVSTGNICLIRDDLLRKAILEAYAEIKVSLDRIALGGESIRPGLQALVARHLPPNTVSRGLTVFDVIVSDEPADLPLIRSAVESLVADEDFEGELNAEYLDLERARQLLFYARETSQARLNHIVAEVSSLRAGST